MSLTARGTSTDYELVPKGTHVARCVQVIDLGTQYSDFYDKWSHKILLGWELPTIVKEDSGEPAMIWKRYTSSLHKKSNLRMDLESWRSKGFSGEEMQGFDLKTILGVPCLINITHDEKGEYANVAAVMALPKGTQVPPQVNDTIVFDIDDWEDEVFKSFSENLQTTIKKAKELQNDDERERAAQEQDREEGPSYGDDDDMDLPF